METSSDGQAYNTHQCQHNCMQSTDSADKEVFGPQSNSRRPRTSSDSTLVVEVSDSDEGPQPAAVTAMQRLGAYTYMYPADTEGVLDPEQFEEDKGWGDDEVDDEGFPSQVCPHNMPIPGLKHPI